MFHVYLDAAGNQLAYNGPSSDKREVHLRNDLNAGAISTSIYRNGKMLAVKIGVTPGQKAVFRFKPSVWIGAVSEVEEGQIMNSAIVKQVNTEIGLLGIASADIVMSGGGSGSTATPYSFSLENIVYK